MSPAPVAHVASHYGLPSETFIVDAVEQLDRLGWSAWVLAWSARERPGLFPPPERILLPPPASLARRVAGRLGGRSGPDRFADAVLPRLAAARPGVVHAHFGWAGVLAMPLARRLGIPLVVTFHATDITVWPHEVRGGRRRYAELFAAMARAIAVSEYMRDELRALGYDRQIDVLPAGVRLDRFRLRAAPPDATPPRLLFVGRLVPRKGLDVLLRALPEVVAAHPGTRLDVLGDGPERAACTELAATLGLAEAVRFHGAATPDQVLAALGRAHAMVVPSRRMPDGEVEGSPVVTKEALAVGVPLVATRNGGLPETVPPARRPELVPEDDADALAAATIRVLDDRDGWAERAREGRAWVEERFAWARLGERTAAIYAEAMAGRAAP